MLFNPRFASYHLTTDPLALDAPTLFPLSLSICGAVLHPMAGYIPALMLHAHDAGRKHPVFGILCLDCKRVADSRSLGVYRCDGRAL